MYIAATYYSLNVLGYEFIYGCWLFKLFKKNVELLEAEESRDLH